jgi:hypothetical protein
MRSGRVARDGAAAEVTAAYRQWATGLTAEPAVPVTSAIRITAVSIVDRRGWPVAHARTGDPISVRIEFTAARPVEDAVFEVFYATHGGMVIHTQHTTALEGYWSIRSGSGAVEFDCDELGLQPGAYTVTATAGSYADGLMHSHSATSRLLVADGKRVRGNFYMPHRAHLVARSVAVIAQETCR